MRNANAFPAQVGAMLPFNPIPDASIRRYGSRGKGRSARDHVVIKAMKALHVLGAAAWTGGVLAMLSISLLKLAGRPAADPDFFIYYIDTCLVMPGLALCILTGLFYSLCTAIGFFKFAWIGYKWCISLCAACMGTLFWLPWGDALIVRLAPLHLDWPLHLARGCLLPENLSQCLLQGALVLSMCLISIYRPLTFRGGLKSLFGGPDMPQLAYGVWDGIAYDNRKARRPAGPPGLDLSIFAEFNEGNPARAFLSDRGFLVFDARLPLLWALLKHFDKVAAESCGKCSPCRTGAPLLRDALERALSRSPENWAELGDIAEQMAATSLCGVGQTGATPLLMAIRHFPQDLPPARGGGRYGAFSALTAPCIEACPAIVNIPRYIDYIRDGHDDLAVNMVLRHFPLAGSCGRICTRGCEAACRRGRVDAPVAIRSLKRYAADSALASGMLRPQSASPTKDARVAVVGAGPVGLTCAYHLLELGYRVDIFEAKDEPGGMIRFGVPAYRLPRRILREEADIVAAMGGRFLFNQRLGRDFTVDGLFAQGYGAVFIACGCPKGNALGVPGEEPAPAGYESGVAFLERLSRGLETGGAPVLEGDALVVGGGNVAMDCCRAAARVTSGRVRVVYRRTEADMPADPAEIAGAKAEGVEFDFLLGPEALVVEDGRVTGLRVHEMERIGPEADGRRGVRPIRGSSRVIPCAHVIAAVGQHTDKSLPAEGIARDRKRRIVVNAAQETSRPGVFAGGDCTTGPRADGPTNMIMGMGQAYFAARSIDRYLSSGQSPFDSRWRMGEWIAAGRLLDDDGPPPEKEPRERVPARELPPEERLRDFREVEQTMTREEAWAEASRCLRCYRVLTVITEAPIPGA